MLLEWAIRPREGGLFIPILHNRNLRLKERMFCLSSWRFFEVWNFNPGCMAQNMKYLLLIFSLWLLVGLGGVNKYPPIFVPQGVHPELTEPRRNKEVLDPQSPVGGSTTPTS